MIILTVSDFIEQSLDQKIQDKALPKIDLILSCGDISPEYLEFLKEKTFSSGILCKRES